MSQVDVMRGGIWISTNAVGAGTVALSLPAPSAGQVHSIKWIMCYTNGGGPLNLLVQRTDTSHIARLTGVGTSLLDKVLRFDGENEDPRGGLTGAEADATLLTLAGGGTASQLTAGWEYVPT